VSRVICPEPACVKLAKEAGEEEVARVVTEVELQRWRWLRDKRDIEKGEWATHLLLGVKMNSTADIGHGYRSYGRALSGGSMPDAYSQA